MQLCRGILPLALKPDLSHKKVGWFKSDQLGQLLPGLNQKFSSWVLWVSSTALFTKKNKTWNYFVYITLCLSRLLWSENIGLHSNLLNPHCMMSLSLDLTGSENRWCRLTVKFRTDIFCSLGYKPTTVRGEPLAPLWASVKRFE